MGGNGGEGGGGAAVSPKSELRESVFRLNGVMHRPPSRLSPRHDGQALPHSPGGFRTQTRGASEVPFQGELTAGRKWGRAWRMSQSAFLSGQRAEDWKLEVTFRGFGFPCSLTLSPESCDQNGHEKPEGNNFLPNPIKHYKHRQFLSYKHQY